MLMYLCLEIS